jgi:formate dehydrogenase major subunit
VTAVQVSKVTQPSEWQREYTEFNLQQLQLLEQRQESVSAK